MTSQEITLIKTSFRQVAPISEQAAALFYARLFELDPSLRELFHGDMAEQGRKLMQVLGLIVGGAERLDDLAPGVRLLGMRHASYRVSEKHYDTVGAALLWTLEKGLGVGFTAEVRNAWAKIYWLLAEMMKAGARDGLLLQSRAVA
jgi:hemoglobin-like flavoprotein